MQDLAVRKLVRFSAAFIGASGDLPLKERPWQSTGRTRKKRRNVRCCRAEDTCTSAYESIYYEMLADVLTTGMHADHDQITMIEADTLEEIYDAAMDFKMGEKAAYIDIVDVVVGIKAPPRGEAGTSKVRQ
jgi:hypothetical protein